MAIGIRTGRRNVVMSYFCCFIAILLGTCHLSHAFALPGSCSGVCTNTHDPSIIVRRDGVYFRFSTGGRIAIHTAPNLTGPWTYQGPVLPSGSIINLNGNQDLWAPDVTEVNGTYYLYYSVSSFGSQDSAIGLARSPTMDTGTWTDVGEIGITSNTGTAYNAIDANLFSESPGEYLLTFGSFWNGLYQRQMDSPPEKANASAPTYQIAYNSVDKAEEGSTLFKNGDYYYLLFSKGSCCGYEKSRPAVGKEYSIMICVSSSPTGGFVDKTGRPCTSGGGTVLLESHDWVYGPGGQGIYEDPSNGPILYYHYVDTRVGYADGQKRFGWNKLKFTGKWPAIT